MATNGPCIPARYVFTFLVSSGLAIIYGLKVNLSVAIVVMVNSTALSELADASDGHHSTDNLNGTISNPEYACSSPDAGTNHTAGADHQDGPFVWSEPIQGLVLGAYFWGYIVSQVPGGRVAEIFSAKWALWASVVINVVFTILTPIAANISYIAVLFVRFMEGLGAGVSLPAMQVMLSKWAPPLERNKLTSFAYAGMSLGTVISLPFSGLLAGTLGWESVFYVQGGLGVIWCVLWIFLVYDSPLSHPRIHPTELELFTSSSNPNQNAQKNPKLPVPWKAIMTSAPFWALAIAHTCNNWGWYMLLVELPTYMKHILRFNIGQNAVLSAVPYLSLWGFSVIWSNLMDYCKNRNLITVTQVRKLSVAGASILPAACFVGVSLAGCDRTAAVTLMTLGTMFMACMYCGILANHVDIASNYAGTLLALTNTFATIPGFIVPVFVGELTHGNQTVLQWQIIFFTTAGIFCLECIVYTLLGTGVEQPWNRKYAGVTKAQSTEEENLRSKP